MRGDRYIRFTGCCCFSLKTGSIILGVINVIETVCTITSLFVTFNGAEKRHGIDKVFVENIAKSIPFNLTNTTMSLLCTLHTVFIAATFLMMYGNIKKKTHLMRPYVWLYLFIICLYCGAFFMRLVFGFMEDLPEVGFDSFWRLVLTGFFGLLIVQVVRSRVMEIKVENRLIVPFTHVPQNIPPDCEEKPKLLLA